jgi:hypothetical protein
LLFQIQHLCRYAALDAAIAAGALSANDIDDDAWEALHLVDAGAAVESLLALAAVGRSAGIAGGGVRLCTLNQVDP